MDRKMLKSILIGVMIGFVISYLFCPSFIGYKPNPFQYVALVLAGIFSPDTLDGAVGANYVSGFLIWVILGGVAGALLPNLFTSQFDRAAKALREAGATVEARFEATSESGRPAVITPDEQRARLDRAMRGETAEVKAEKPTFVDPN